MLVLANVTWDGLVADDYYRQGMEINRSLARDTEAARLGPGGCRRLPRAGGGGGAAFRPERHRGGCIRRSADPSIRARDTRGRRCPDIPDPRHRRGLAGRAAGAGARQVVRGARQRAMAVGRAGTDASRVGRSRAPRHRPAQPRPVSVTREVEPRGGPVPGPRPIRCHRDAAASLGRRLRKRGNPHRPER